MKFFVDTADVAEIRDLADAGLLDGVTTNPSLIAKSGRPFKEVIAEICKIVEGPVSAEVTALDFAGMIKEGNDLRKIAKNVTVKVPLTIRWPQGLQGAAGRWGHGQCHAVLQRQPGAAGGQGRSLVHFALRGPP